MKIDEIHEQALKDLKIDISNLDYESLRTHELYIKYLKMHSNEKMRLSYYTNKLNSAYKDCFRYYSGKSDEPFDEYIDKSDLKTYIFADEKYQLAKDRVTMQEEIVNYLEKLLKQISDRSWQIRNALEDIKFKNGG